MKKDKIVKGCLTAFCYILAVMFYLMGESFSSIVCAWVAGLTTCKLFIEMAETHKKDVQNTKTERYP